VRVRLRLQEAGGARLDHNADSACSDRRFELYTSRTLIFLLRTWRALLSFLLYSFFFAANLASIAVISSLLSFYSGLL
jgi:hypothetical protein